MVGARLGNKFGSQLDGQKMKRLPVGKQIRSYGISEHEK